MTFDYINSLSSVPKVCTHEQFVQLTRSEAVKQNITDYRNGNAEAKKKLPAFCFHASFGGKRRANQNAKPSGMFMVDYDHLTDEELSQIKSRILQVRVKTEAQKLIVLAHITPSGHGLRVVARCITAKPFDKCKTLGEFQATMVDLIGFPEKADGVVSDFARLSFCPMATDIFIQEDALFVAEAEVLPDAGLYVDSAQKVRLPSEDSGQTSFKGVDLEDVFALYFSLNGGLPREGERNSAFYRAARDLRYICDFNPAVVARAMPKVGLSDEEVLAVCRSACESSRAAEMPAKISKLVEMLQVEASAEASTDDVTQPETGSLPVVFREVSELLPPDFVNAGILAMLPVLGTLSTGVRARYLDGQIHSTSFMTMVCAEQASGKSFVRQIVNTLLHRLKEEDTVQREIEKAYQKELKLKRNQKDQPEDPRAVVRIIPASVSLAKMLQRLEYAQGKHLFTFAEEMDTITKSNRAGAWSEKSDLYRNAFDNSEYGQDYISENSWSFNGKVFYNMLTLGTPRQRERFFKDVENGLVSRFCFAELPDQFGARMPKLSQLSGSNAAKLDAWVQKLMAANGDYNLDPINERLAQWLEEQRLRSIKEGNRARDIFRRRSAVIGFRAALVLAPLYGFGNYDKILAPFAVRVADLVLEGQLQTFGSELNRVTELKVSEKVKFTNLLDALPDIFSITEITSLLANQGKSTPSRNVTYWWKKANLIKQIDKNHFQKV